MSDLQDRSVTYIKITGCSDPLMWYRNHVGEIVPVITEDVNEYVTREIGSDYPYINIIRKCDAQVIGTT